MFIRSVKTYCDYHFDLRWKLIYINKPPKFGQWCRPASIAGEKASEQNRDGLAYAMIESKDLRTRKISILAECKAVDYIEHRWIAALPVPVSMLKHTNVSGQGGIQGMSLIARDFKMHIHVDGKIYKEAMTERNSNYA